MRVAVTLVVAAALLMPPALVAAGGWFIVQRQTGTRVEAEVLGCDLDVGYRRAAQYCTARWEQDGVVRTGPIQGSGEDQVGEVVEATLHGDELHSRSLALPLLLLGLGTPLCWFPCAWLRRKLRGTPTSTT